MAEILSNLEEAEKQEALAKHRGETLFVGGGQAVHGRGPVNSSPLSAATSLFEKMFSSEHRVSNPSLISVSSPRIILWKDGWELKLQNQSSNQGLRSYEDPLLEEIMEGNAPSSILELPTGQDVDIHIDTSHINDTYSSQSVSDINEGVRLGGGGRYRFKSFIKVCHQRYTLKQMRLNHQRMLKLVQTPQLDTGIHP